MKTPYLNNKIILLENYEKDRTISSYQKRELEEYRKIKNLIRSLCQSNNHTNG